MAELYVFLMRMFAAVEGVEVVLCVILVGALAGLCMILWGVVAGLALAIRRWRRRRRYVG